MKTKSKKQQLLELLQEGYHLSKIQILNKIGLFNSGEQVRRLRNEGHNIHKYFVKNEISGDNFAVYYLKKQ